MTVFAVVGLTAAAVFYLGANQNKRSANTDDQTEPAAGSSGEVEIPAETQTSQSELTPIEFEDESGAEIKAKSEAEPASEILPAEDAEETAPTERIMERFTIAIGQNGVDMVAKNLLDQGFIGDEGAFKAAIKPGILAFVAGGYKLSKTMDETQVASALQEDPYMKWIIIPEGLRKEETAEALSSELGWNEDQKNKWLTVDTASMPNYIEGVYFPDTYLIPVDEEPGKTAARMQARFNEAFAVFLPQFNEQNIKWTTGLTFASIVQREAKNTADMPLIAGILWNRLEQGMALGADATLQYARGDTGSGWWSPAGAADKAIDSPYNTYANKGLPPHPICSPGVAAIEATLAPAESDCIYYLHGNDGTTRCAASYEEHLNNIELYLKNGQ